MQSFTAPDLHSATKTGPVMQSSTTTALLRAISREYDLDVLAARAFVQAASDAAPRLRRGVHAWVHAVVTFSF